MSLGRATLDPLTPLFAMREPTVITGLEVAQYLRSIGVDFTTFRMRDDTYACVSKTHMLTKQYDSVAKVLFELGLEVWVDDWDCDDFTITFAWWSRVAHRATQRNSGQYFADSPAVFECWIAAINHAVVLCIEHTPEGLSHFFIEPQPRASSRELAVAANQLPTITLVK
jgi:hypothetical protein